jgi:hypothetical protein
LEFNKRLLDMDRYLKAEKYAKQDLHKFYADRLSINTDFKTVALYIDGPQQLYRLYSKKLNYNSIIINYFSPYCEDIVRNAYGEYHEYDGQDKIKNEVNDVAEGFFRVEYEYKTETETRTELIFIVAAGDTSYKDNYIIATDSAREEIVKLIKKAVKKEKRRKVSKGIYTIGVFKEKLYYMKKAVKEINQTPIISPAKDILEKDMDFFFNNINIFSCFNQTPNRKVLLAGPQGTGKSSLSYMVARKYSDKIPVVFTTDIQSASFHLKMSAKKGLPTILVLEDADATFQQSRDYTGSQVLNLLDGINLPHNKSGFYMIMTTNYPDKIEDRIKKRPGRVDKIITVSVLNKEYALECATAYMRVLMDDKNRPKENESISKDYLSVFNGLSGAQIKDLITATRIYMAQNQVHDLNVELVQKVKDQIKDSLKSLDLIDKDLNANMNGRIRDVGFGLR